MNLVIKPLLLMEHNWIATIGPVQASAERAPRPGSDNEAGLVNETSGAHYQRSLPCLWCSSPWALEIGALACSPEPRQFNRKRENALPGSSLCLQSMPQVNQIHIFHIPQLHLFPYLSFLKMFHISCPGKASRILFGEVYWACILN